jgi:high-affinity Fe2+/Pb2+ permease
MNKKALGIILLIIAAGLAWYGYDISQSVGGKLNSAFNGGPSNRALMFYAGAAVCAVLGALKLK